MWRSSWRNCRGRRADTLGSLILGIPSAGVTVADLGAGRGLRYIGNVGTGFTTAARYELEQKKDYDDAVATDRDRAGRIVGVEHALDVDRSGPVLTDPLEIVPRERGAVDLPMEDLDRELGGAPAVELIPASPSPGP